MSDMRRLIESVDTVISEGRYGPHGMGRRVNDAVDAVFDTQLDRLGNDPTVEEIYDAVRAVRRDLADQELMGFPRTNSYINQQFIGAVAEKLELPGLYSPSGKVFYSVEKDEAGRYTGSGGASRRVARELAEKGYLSQEAAERLGVTNFLGMDITTGNPDSDENNATRDAQTFAAGRRQVRRDVSRFLELLAKRNQETVSDGVTYISSLARLLTEALSDAEEAEFQELLSKVNLLNPEDYEDEETRTAVQQARQAAADLEEPEEPEAPEAPQEPQSDADNADNAEPTSNDSRTPLADFAQSGKGGIKNDPGETAAIEQLQEFLSTMGWDIGVDGRYGPQTTSAVKEFQQLVGITDDGDAGPETIENVLTWGTLPDVKTWAPQLKELSDLIAAGATFTPPATESVSFNDIRSMITMVESLFEEVTDQQQARAMELYNALKTKIEGGAEYVSGLPEVLQTQLIAAQEWTSSAGETPADENAPTITAERATQIATDFAAAGGVGRSGNGTLGHIILGHSTDEQGINDRLKELQNAADWQLVVDAYREVGNKSGRLRSGNLINDLMGSLDTQEYQQYVATELQRIGITPGEGSGDSDEASSGDPAGGEPDAQGNVQPRPTGTGRGPSQARSEWDRQYGETHNPDGTPK